MEDSFQDTPSIDIDPYAVLEISETASAAEVKSAYKKLALKYHPGQREP